MEMTTHSIIRAKERTSFTESTFKRTSLQALRCGKEADYFSSKEREYLLKKQTRTSKAIFYNDYIYITSPDRNTLITIFPAPKWFGKKSMFFGKERIRKPKQFYRTHDFYDGRNRLQAGTF